MAAASPPDIHHHHYHQRHYRPQREDAAWQTVVWAVATRRRRGCHRGHHGQWRRLVGAVGVGNGGGGSASAMVSPAVRRREMRVRISVWYGSWGSSCRLPFPSSPTFLLINSGSFSVLCDVYSDSVVK